MKICKRTYSAPKLLLSLLLVLFIHTTETSESVVEIGIWNVSNFPYINLFLGQNKTSLKLLFDTGSTALVVKEKACTTCKDENPFDHSTFDSSSSSTLSFLTPSDASCPTSSLCGRNCSRKFTYLDKTELRTCWVNDLVTVRLLNTKSNTAALNNYFNFYIIKHQEGDINMDGIVGVQDFGNSIQNNLSSMDDVKKLKGNTSEFIKNLGNFGFIEYMIGSYNLKHRTMLVDIGEYKLVFGYNGHLSPDTNNDSKENKMNTNKKTYGRGFMNFGVIRDRAELKQVEPKNDPRRLWYKNNKKKIIFDPKIHKLTNLTEIKETDNYNTKYYVSNSNLRDAKKQTNPKRNKTQEFKVSLKPYDFFKYEVNINRLKFNNKNISTKSYRSFLDTGSTNIYIPKALHDKLIKEILALVPGFKIFSGENSYCFQEEQVKDILDKIPKLILVLENDNQIKLSIDILVKTKFPKRDKELYCSAISSLGEDTIIIGFPFFLHRKILFDYKNGKILISGSRDQMNEIGDVYRKLSFIIKFASLLL